MKIEIGKTKWVIAEGYIPSRNNRPKLEIESHDTLSVLNTTDRTAHIELTVHIKNRKPVGPFHLTVPSERTTHFMFNELNDPQRIPRNEDFASLIVSDVPIVVQYTRMESKLSENAQFSTMAYS